MRAIVCAATLAASTLAMAAVAAETADVPSQRSAAPAAFSVQTTLIADILKSARAKAVLEKQLPGLRPFYGRISDLTLAQVAQASHGLLGDAKLKAVQAEFDSIR